MKKSHHQIVFSIVLILTLLGNTYGQEAWPNEINGLIDTEWDQGSPYNKNHPIDPVSGDTTLTGCNATAIGQLINFWGQKTGFPKNVSFLSNDSYYSTFDPGDGQGLREIYIDATAIGFENLDYLDLSENDVADIILASGVAIKSKYSSGATQANMDDIPKALERRFGFYQPQLITNNLGFKDGLVREKIIDEIKSGRPVILQINSGGDNLFEDVVDGFKGQLSSHIVVCDGYKIDEQGIEYFHLNMGWGGRTNFFGQETNDWFSLPDGMIYPYSNVLSAVINIQNGIGINEINHGNLTVNSKSEILIEGVAPEDGDYYIGIWDANGFSKPNWTWYNDYLLLSPSIGSYSVNLLEGQSFSIPFELRPTSTSVDLQVWLYKKSALGFWWVQKIDHRLEAAIDDVLPYVTNVKSGTTNNSSISVFFSEDIDVNSIDERSISIEGTTSGNHYYNWAYDAVNNSIILDPFTEFITGEEITLTLGYSLTDLAQNKLDGNNDGTAGPDYTYTFTVVDYNPPRNLTHQQHGNYIKLDWDTPTGSLHTGYNIYRDGTLVSTINTIYNTSYEEYVENGFYKYSVTAYYNSVEEESEEAKAELISIMAPEWEISKSESNANVILPRGALVDIDGKRLSEGDYIGAFILADDSLICGGFSQFIPNENINITVWKDNPDTEDKDGFVDGDNIKWLSWDSEMRKTDTLLSSYQETDGILITSQGSLFDNTTSLVTAFHNYPGWEYSTTENNQTIIIPEDAELILNGKPLETGDYIGVFYDNQGAEFCAGFGRIVEGESTAISVWSDDPATTELEGLVENQELIIKIWDRSERTTHTANCDYEDSESLNSTGQYISNSISEIVNLSYFKYPAPINLKAIANENSIRLFWDQPETTSICRGTVIFRDNVQLTYIDDCGVNSFEDVDIEDGYNKYFMINIYEGGQSDISSSTYGLLNSTDFGIFDFVQTSNNHSIIFDAGSSLILEDQVVKDGDIIGAFFESGGTLICGGRHIWDSQGNNALTIWGDDSTTPEKDGFSTNELIQFKALRISDTTIYDGIATYAEPSGIITHKGNYQNDGISLVDELVFSNDLPLYVESLIPSNSEIIQINEGENLQLSPVIIDPENGTISYSWSVNSVEVSDQATYLFETDFQSSGDYAVELTCEDLQGYNHDELTISWSIEVLNVNTTPTISDGTYGIEENSAVSISVGTVSASDPENDDLTFSILSGNELGAFQIDQNTGEITVADSEPLDFETNLSFELSLQVNDGEFTDTAIITISLNDVNEAPSADDATFTINENSSVSTSVGTVSTSDPEDDVLTFSITSGNDLGAFQIDQNTGEITVADSEPLDFETNPSFELSIQVNDGEFTDTAIITISLNDVNEAPIADNAAFSIDENPTVLTSLGTVSTSDPEDDVLTFSITSGNDLGAFQIDQNTGEIFVADSAPLDFETNPTFRLEVEVSDGELSDIAKITVNLNDVDETTNSAPTISDATFSIDENSTVSNSVGTVTASDPDGDGLAFSIISGNDLGAFQIDSSTGEIFVADSAPLDFETNPAFELTIEASDSEFSDEALITVNLIDLNEAPSIADGSFTIDENSAVGSSVGTVTASDPDGDHLVFSIASGNDLGAFQIDENTGEISVDDSSPLDFETNPTFTLAIEVSDGELTENGNITVNLNDVDEPSNSAPSISNITLTLNENSSISVSVGTVSASDPDGDDLTFSILSGNDLGAFQVDQSTGEIIVDDSAPLDFETNPSFSLTVEASDGELSATGEITINLLDLNESPSLADETFEIPEDQEEGTVTGTLQAEDPENDTLSYSIVSGNDQGAFEINQSSGELMVANAAILNYEAQSNYELTVAVSDGEFQTEALLTIEVTDVNEAPSDLQLSASEVQEDADIGTVIGVLTTEDEDADESFSYELMAGNDLFSVDAEQLVTNSTFDIDETAIEEVEVSVQDKGGLSLSKVFEITIIHVEVLDAQDATSIRLYPNPVRDVLLIEGIDATRVTISDLSGRTVIRSRGNAVDVSTLPSGVFLVRIMDHSGAETMIKIVKE